MASHWPIIVGINQYHALQPLMYAQFDALELRDFLVNEVGLPAEYCALLTDVASVVYQGAAAPTREVIWQRLVQSCDRAGPDDTLWFFFSGYGVQWQGQDYLLPIDADPNCIEQTGILVEAVLSRLSQGNQRQSVVMLDINRHQSALSSAPGSGGLGTQSLALAQSLGVPLVLSCQPDQFSQETLAVRHGLFTEALIEAMRFHGCLTLAQVVDYLGDRLPELCQHHWRPVQNPVAVIPQGQQYLMLVPPSLVGQMPIGTMPDPEASFPDWSDGEGYSPSGSPDWPISPGPIPPDATDSAPSPAQPPYEVAVRPWPAGEPPTVEQPISPRATPRLDPDPPLEPRPDPHLEPPLEPGELPVASSPTPGDQMPLAWQRWAMAAVGLLLLGLLGLLGRNLSSFRRSPDPAAIAPVPPATPQTPAPSPSEAEPSAEPPAEPSEALAPEPVEPLFPGTAVSGAEALSQARNALSQRQFGEALGWLRQIPEVERPADYEALVTQAETGYASASLSGNAALDEARRLIEPLSASLFNDAIEQARQVPLGDPAYDQAQADIQRWSQVIVDLAEGRAASGDLEGAIAAARLVPEDQAEIWGQAQTQIQRWEQRRLNRQLLQEAQSVLQPDQATSFQTAIALAQQIPPDYPESPIARDRIDQWSRDILAIARARAADGQVPGAISAAGLVPPGTSAYDQAQAEILRWQGQ